MKKTNEIFEIYQFVLFTLNAFMYMCAVYLLIPFVKIYTKGVIDADYINPQLMVFVVLYGIFSVTRIPYNNTVYISGKFKETFLQPVICSCISIVLMIVLTKINYTYAIIGSVFFFAANTFYQHIKLPKLIEGFINRHFWRHFSVIMLGLSFALLAFKLFPAEPTTFFQWIVTGCIVAVCFLIVLVVLLVLIDRNSLQLSINYFKNRFNK